MPTFSGSRFSGPHDYLNDWWTKHGSYRQDYGIDPNEIDCGTDEKAWISMATKLVTAGVLDTPLKIRLFMQRAKFRCMGAPQPDAPCEEEPIFIGEAIVHREEKIEPIPMPVAED